MAITKKKVTASKKVSPSASAKTAIHNRSVVLSELQRLDDAFHGDKFEERANTTLANGKDLEILEYVNGLVNTLSDKLNWYQAIVDAVPFPIQVTDDKMKWTFLNKPFEKLLVQEGLIRDREQAIGLPCRTAKKNICGTKQCGYREIQEGKTESFFEWCGMSCKQDSSRVLDAKGELIGFVEVVQDLTPTLRAKDYTSAEVSRLASNLSLLASGNLDFDLELGKGDEYTTEVKEQFKQINDNLVQVQKAVGGLIEDTERLSEAAIAGDLNARGDASKHAGEFRKVVQGFDQTLDTVIEKLNWYQAIVDAVPFPIHVIDKDMKWTFLNKAFEKLMVDRGYVKNRAEAVGMPCSTANATICNTTECGIRRLQRGIGDSFFDWGELNCKQDTSYVMNVKGEQVGFVEVVQDMTPSIRVRNYTSSEMERVANNLTLLASGDLSFDLDLGKSDKFTIEVEEHFKKINNNLVQVKSAVGGLISDAENLAHTAIEGKLDARADISKHSGDFRKVVQSFNQTLDAVIGPLNVSAGYVDRISRGDIPEKITDNYNGDFNIIKNNLNACIDGLQGLVETKQVLQRMAENDFSTSVEGKYSGIFEEVKIATNGAEARIKNAVNIAEHIAVGDYEADLQELKRVGRRSANDSLIPAFIKMMDAIKALVTDAGDLSKAAVEGRLSVRADASRHQGEFSKVVQGVNDTLDAVVNPIQDVERVLGKLADGDFTVEITKEYAGEFGDLKKALSAMSRQVRTALLQIGNEIGTLAADSEQLGKVSQQMSASAEETAAQANVVSAASEQVSTNIQTVATGADEMGASIKEIAKNTADATKIANNAVQLAHSTNETVKKLGVSSAEIGQVIKVITSIAQQTNLLALNATIEAARAGEAGKGFAVVANEVKELAKQTAKATEDISQKIQAIQQDTGGAVTAIGQITEVIGQISDIQNTIASAIEEQSATTNEISRNLSEAAKGGADITLNITSVAQVARTTTEAAGQTQASAKSLEEMAAQLRELVSQFKYEESDGRAMGASAGRR
jgi:methyl-accepting chemotaxis protein